MRRSHPFGLRQLDTRHSHDPAAIRSLFPIAIRGASARLAVYRSFKTGPPLCQPRRRPPNLSNPRLVPSSTDQVRPARPLSASNFSPGPKTAGEAALSYHPPGRGLSVSQSSHVSLLHSILVSLLDHNQRPLNQQCLNVATSGDAFSKSPLRHANGNPEPVESVSRNETLPRSFSHADRPIVALCPLEGGEGYVREAVFCVAGEVNANVIRIDLPLALGFEGPDAPLKALGIAAPAIPRSSNPLLKESSEASEFAGQTEAQDSFAEEEEPAGIGGDALEGVGVIRLPLMVPSPLNAIRDNSFIAQRHPASTEERVAFFEAIINRREKDTVDVSAASRPTIILLEGSTSMSETTDAWWPSLTEAVRRCRTKSSKDSSSKQMTERAEVASPISIVMSVTPSLLASHTRPFLDQESGDRTAYSQLDSAKFAMATVAERLSSVLYQAHGDPRRSTGRQKQLGLWSASLERDARGRLQRNIQRIEAIRNPQTSDMTDVLPFHLNSQVSEACSPSSHWLPTTPILSTESPSGAHRPDGATSSAQSLGSIVHIIPSHRDLRMEASLRRQYRRIVSATLMSQALREAGGCLTDLDRSLQEPIEGQRYNRGTAADPWGYEPICWSDAKRVARSALGQALASTTDHSRAQPVPVCWDGVLSGAAALQTVTKALDRDLSKHLQAMSSRGNARPSSADKSSPSCNSAEEVKKSKNLNSYERRLLGCIVDTEKLNATGFDQVHLPSKTIDAIRTIVSLPLLYPAAFRHGLLRSQFMGGLLLFGPPGTGKTLLARAVAGESGAQMLAIQPSDVNNMYVGESEKIVKAIFSLARRLSPCIVFLDEVDAIFGGRSARDPSASSKAHNQILTEFMQEMDGLSSAISNNDHRVVVVGATNRPFDIDDAMLRRLPRRLLVDLPDERDREAILRILLAEEALHPDVSLRELARGTDGYSGSDLKHVCVSAALAALKENVPIPWLATSTPATVLLESSASHSNIGPQESCTTSDPATSHQPSYTSIAASETAAPCHAPSMSLAGTVFEAQRSSADQYEASNAACVVVRSPEKSRAHRTSPQHDMVGAEGLALPTHDSRPAGYDARVLTSSHFERALEEVTPSSNELGTLPELRKWAQQFGEGGSKRGKKTGFGRGFGFSRDKTQTAGGYGRVLQNH